MAKSGSSQHGFRLMFAYQACVMSIAHLHHLLCRLLNAFENTALTIKDFLISASGIFPQAADHSYEYSCLDHDLDGLVQPALLAANQCGEVMSRDH